MKTILPSFKIHHRKYSVQFDFFSTKMIVLRTSGLFKDNELAFQFFTWIDVEKLSQLIFDVKQIWSRFKRYIVTDFIALANDAHWVQRNFPYTYCVHIHQFIWALEFIVASNIVTHAVSAMNGKIHTKQCSQRKFTEDGNDGRWQAFERKISSAYANTRYEQTLCENAIQMLKI